MSIDRLIPTSGTGVTGTDFAGAIQEELTGLWGNSVIPLADVAGTGDAITATVSPALTDGLAAGMNFWLIAAADNTGPATIAIGDEDAVDLVDDDGQALGAALLKAGRRFLLGFDGTAMRIYGTSGQKRVADYQVFTADGTWNKPAGTPDDALIVVELWGGGGAGPVGSHAGASGSGGGEYKPLYLRAGDVSSSVSVTVAAASATGAGNNSSFGTFVTAYGGARAIVADRQPEVAAAAVAVLSGRAGTAVRSTVGRPVARAPALVAPQTTPPMRLAAATDISAAAAAAVPSLLPAASMVEMVADPSMAAAVAREMAKAAEALREPPSSAVMGAQWAPTVPRPVAAAAQMAAAERAVKSG